MLSKKHLSDICMLYDAHNMCRYLYQDDNDSSKCYCLKHRKADKDKIDEMVNNFFRDCKKKNIDPAKQGVPIGDNCPGYPLLKHVEQGYDKD